VQIVDIEDPSGPTPRGGGRPMSERFEAAADLLWQHWRSGTRLTSLPDDLRPGTRGDGYRVQAHLERRSRHPLLGWKIAATSRAGQAHIAVDGPMAGRLIAEHTIESGGTLPFGANHMRVAEAEFAFRLGRELLPRTVPYGLDEVLAAVGALHPAIELPDSRYEDFTTVGAPQLIADNACSRFFVLGAAAPDRWRSVDLVQHAVTGTVLGKHTHHGTGANVLGDPRIALLWLVNEVSALGLTLKAGQIVTTGTCIVPVPIEPGDAVRADFGDLGEVSVRLDEDGRERTGRIPAARERQRQGIRRSIQLIRVRSL
jgi:2-keto-4-pentenoate hydratase